MEPIVFEPAHRLSKSLLSSGPAPDQKGFKISTLTWRGKFEPTLTPQEVLHEALEATRFEAAEAAERIRRAFDPDLPLRERQSAAAEASFKTACAAGLWEFAQWSCTAGAGLPALATEEEAAGRKKLEAIGAVAGMALGALGAMFERLSGHEPEVLARARRVDEMVGFAFCHESLVQWRVLEERRQIEAEIDSGEVAPARSGGPRI